MSDSGTTSELFIQGAGKTFSVNENVGIIKAGANTYLFNLMGNAFDLTDYQKKDLASAVEGATTVEGALAALSANKVSMDLVPSDASASNKLATYTAIAVSSSDTITTLLSKVKVNQIANVNTSVSAFNVSGISISYLLGTLEKFSNDGLQFKGVAKDTSNNMYDAVLWFNDATVIIANPQYSYIIARPTSSVTSGSTAPVTSGGVFNAFGKGFFRAHSGNGTVDLTLGFGVYLLEVDEHLNTTPIAVYMISIFANNGFNIVELGKNYSDNHISVTRITDGIRATTTNGAHIWVNAMYFGDYS